MHEQRQVFLEVHNNKSLSHHNTDGWSIISWSSHLLDFVLDGQLDAAEAGSVVGAWRTLVDVAI